MLTTEAQALADYYSGGIYLLLPNVIMGAEEGDGPEGDNRQGDPDPAGVESGGSHTEEGEEEDEEHEDSDDDGVKGLKSALAAERKRAAAAEKKLKAYDKAKADEDLANKSEVEQAQIKLQESTDRLSRLSSGILQRELTRAIEDAAEKAGFADPQDAVALIDRAKLDYTQDEDDPSIIEIDHKQVAAEIKALAAKKPHYLKAGTDDGGPTGGQFGGSKRQKQTSEDLLKDRYPTLR